MNLFEQKNLYETEAEAPLAARMRPRTLEEFVGQEHLVGEGTAIRKAIENDQLGSVIFWGPPGCGKSTLARIIAGHTRCHFVEYSAVTSGVAEVRKAIEEARNRRQLHGQRTILFVDEIHRFNRAQQDAFLPHVENGTIILMGATTENPYFAINAPLLSRSRVLRFEPLTEEHLRIIVQRALADEERGLGKLHVTLPAECMDYLLRIANGDARIALNVLEAATALAEPDSQGHRVIAIEMLEQVVQQRAARYDREGDEHYDTISAFIKSVRGSDPDAALHYLARMLRAGEDPRFIARRLVILASEDIGNADPHALPIAVAAMEAVQMVGMPEAQITLAQATTYLACAPKSNASYVALNKALHDLETQPLAPVPLHLRDANYPAAQQLGHGKEYIYPHSYPGHWAPQRYLPEGNWSLPYYEPSDSGTERKIKERLNLLRELQQRHQATPNPTKDEPSDKPGEGA
ncbi:MAG: replication-associated recombination protein A [Armatimonadota bacterium]